MQSWSSVAATAHFGRSGVPSRAHADWGPQAPACSWSDLRWGCSSGMEVPGNGCSVQLSHHPLLSSHLRMCTSLHICPHAWVSWCLHSQLNKSHQVYDCESLSSICRKDIKQGGHRTELCPWEQTGDSPDSRMMLNLLQYHQQIFTKIQSFPSGAGVAHNHNNEEAKGRTVASSVPAQEL